MKRRSFIKAGLSGAVTLSVGFDVNANEASIEHDLNALEFTGDGLFTLHADNSIELHFTKLEMGQGVEQAYKTIVAEELNVHPRQINIVPLPYNSVTDPIYQKINYGVTGGSTTIRSGWSVLRKAAAGLRELMNQCAAEQWRTNVDNCYSHNAQVIWGNKTIPWASLIKVASKRKLPLNPKLTAPSDFKWIGKDSDNRRHRSLVLGNKTFSLDNKFDDVLYATTIHSPTIDSYFVNANLDKVKSIEGIVDVIILRSKELTKNAKAWDPLDDAGLRDSVAVVAKSHWQAISASKMLEITWSESSLSGNQDTLESDCLDSLMNLGEVLLEHGDINKVFNAASEEFAQHYSCPYVSHHYLEPLNATANVHKGSAELWLGTQSPSRDAYAISKALDIDINKIKINVLAAGGAFGRKFNPDFSVEAAYLSKMLQHPVKLFWTREEEVKCGQQGDLEVQKFNVALDENNQPSAYQWQSNISGKWVNEVNIYLIHLPHFRLMRQRRSKTLALAPWRAVQTARSNFGVECFIDELAQRSKQDPLAYRKQLLKHPVNLKGLPDKSQWLNGYSNSYRKKYLAIIDKFERYLSNKPTEKGFSRGVALGSYGGTVIAQAVDLKVQDNICIIDRVISTVDCGIVINPQGALQQIEGGNIWGLNALFMPPTQFNNGVIEQSNFHDAPLIKLEQIPVMDTHFIPSDEAPTGLGEPSVCSIAPAVLNAIYAATGLRITRRNVCHLNLQASKR